MDYNSGTSYAYDQYYSDPIYLENPVATTSELILQNKKLAESARPVLKKKSIEKQALEDAIAENLNERVRTHVEKYFDHQTDEVYIQPKTRMEGFEDIERDNKCLCDYTKNPADMSIILIILIIIMFILSVFQYAQTQSLHNVITSMMFKRHLKHHQEI